MAESCARAFGRYLRTLRERKGLSLDEVSALSRTFPDSIGKSYLSRCENGRQRLALAKTIPLSRIYEVPPVVFLERLELDLELEKLGGPETTGLEYAALTLLGKNAADRGRLWDAYAYFRDSVPVAAASPLMGRLRDSTEQSLCSFINLSTAAVNLGRAHLAIHELQHVEASGGLSPRIVPILLERLSRTHRVLKRLNLAREYADAALSEAEKVTLVDYMGYFYSNRARVADEEDDYDTAISLSQKAFDCFKAAGQEVESARTLSNLAQSYFLARRYRSARRALSSAERIAAPLGQDRTRALMRILLGQLEELEGRPGRAAARWREAAEMAKRLQDKIVRFQAEYFLYKQAIEQGKLLAARAIERRLRRASPWIPPDVEELAAFRRLVATQGLAGKKKRVAAPKPPRSSTGNA